MKLPRNLFVNSILILLIIFIVLVASDIIAVEILAIPELHQVLQLIIPLVLIVILSKGKIGSYGLKLPLSFPYIKITLWVVLIQILTYIPFIFYSLKGEGHPLSNSNFGEIILKAWILAPFAEEILFRSMAQSFMSPLKHIRLKVFRVNFSYPVIFTAIVFSLAHLPPLFRGEDIVLGITIILGAFSFGILFGYIREKTDSIVPAIFGHILANIIATFIDFFPFH